MKKKKTAKKEPENKPKILYKRPWVIILAVLALLLAVFFAYVYSHPDEAEIMTSNESAQLHTVLAVYGIDDVVVGSSDTLVFVRYELPEGMEKDSAVRYIAIAAADAYPSTQQIIIETYSQGEQLEHKTLKTSDFSG